MAVLFDQFSYRINKTTGGLYYDRWHGKVFPEISMPEKLYFLNSIIAALLTHRQLIIRADSIEELIDCIGFNAFKLLYERGELRILDNWWFPTFMYNADIVFFMNMHEKQYQDKVCNRLKGRIGAEASYYIMGIFKDICNSKDSDMYDYWDHLAQDNMYEDFTFNNRIRALLGISSENTLKICTEEDTWSATRLCLFERSLEWAKQLRTDEIILEEEAKQYLVYKSNIQTENIIEKFNLILRAKGIPNLSILYYNEVISMDDILRVRDRVAFGKFINWLEDNQYSVKELELALLNGRPKSSQIEKWIRWAFVCGMPFLLPQVGQSLGGIGLSFIEQLLPQFSGRQIPNLYFDRVLTAQFNTKKLNHKLQSKFGF